MPRLLPSQDGCEANEKMHAKYSASLKTRLPPFPTEASASALKEGRVSLCPAHKTPRPVIRSFVRMFAPSPSTKGGLRAHTAHELEALLISSANPLVSSRVTTFLAPGPFSSLLFRPRMSLTCAQAKPVPFPMECNELPEFLRVLATHTQGARWFSVCWENHVGRTDGGACLRYRVVLTCFNLFLRRTRKKKGCL